MKLIKGIGLGLALMTTACASMQNTDGTINDPLEPMNRAVFSFNEAADNAVLTPLSKAYTTVVPEPPRDGVSNVMRNLREPWTFVNDILQLKFGRAGTTLGRFVVNSTIGIGGLFKVSDDMGIEYHSEDLGQTLAVWGVGDGPYLVLPFLGPSNGRDTVGFATYFFLDPTTFAFEEIDKSGNFFDLALIRSGIDAFDARVRFQGAIDALYQEDDPYITARSLYWQNRRFQIYDGDPPSAVDDDFFDSLEDEEGY